MQKNVVITVLLVIIAMLLLWPGRGERPNKGKASSGNLPSGAGRPDPWTQQRRMEQAPPQDPWRGPPPDGYPYIGNPSAPYGGRYAQPGPYEMPRFRPDPTGDQSLYSQQPYTPDAGRYQYPYTPGYRFRNPPKVESQDRYSGGYPEDHPPPVSGPRPDWGDSPYPQGPPQYPRQDYQDPSIYAPSPDRYSAH